MNIQIPELKEILVKIQDVETLPVEGVGEDKTTKKTIRDRIEDYNRELIENNNKSNSEKIINYCVLLLARASKEKTFLPFKEYLLKEHPEISETIYNDQVRNDLKIKLINLGYRWANKGPEIIYKAIDLFNTRYNGKITNYLEEAHKFNNIQNDFTTDQFLKIKYVKYKVRDLGLSSFSNKYIAIDTHVIRTILKTGLILNGYYLGISPYSDLQNRYLKIRKILYNIAKKVDFSLGEIDRAFWNFGRSICKSRNPKCASCPISEICVLNSKKLKRN